MATEIEPLIMPFDPLWVTTSKREYREAVRRMGEEPGDAKGKDGLTSCIPGKGCVIWISRKVKAPDLYALAAHEATHAACSECGCDYLCMSSATYCPDCGAKVAENG